MSLITGLDWNVLRSLIANRDASTPNIDDIISRIMAANMLDIPVVLPLTPTRLPIQVYSRGWFGGSLTGAIVNEFGNSGKPQTQTVINKSNTKSGTAVTAGTGALLYTVTSGKILYMTDLVVFSSAAGNGLDLRDSTTLTGTPNFAVQSGQVSGIQEVFHFTAPLIFSVGVFIDVGVNSTVTWSFTGWEE